MTSPEDCQLTDLPNIGSALAARLRAVGVTTPQQLRTLGAPAVVRLLTAGDDPASDRTACYNTAYAIAGAIAGVRWHDLPKAQRAALREQIWGDQR